MLRGNADPNYVRRNSSANSVTRNSSGVQELLLRSSWCVRGASEVVTCQNIFHQWGWTWRQYWTSAEWQRQGKTDMLGVKTDLAPL